uniref:Uncharacterized protein n=1 Tax=Manihot esculenta TaxID=3983 RepID=A0A2C9VRG8_MANES
MLHSIPPSIPHCRLGQIPLKSLRKHVLAWNMNVPRISSSSKHSSSYKTRNLRSTIH